MKPMENKQTAVDWLVDKLMKGEFINSTDELIEQAKALEKSQMMKAQGYAISHADMTNNKGEFDCEQYYKETYGKETDRS